MTEHRWSGWPGAWCLDCGMEDQTEIALADGDIYFEVDENSEDETERTYGKMCYKEGVKEHLEKLKECSEPGSNRFNPYVKKENEV